MLEGEMQKIDGCDMGKFGTLNTSKEVIDILGYLDSGYRRPKRKAIR